MVNSFTISANPKDVKYLNVDTRVRGFGPNRLKALEMEGRWVLSPDSIPFITEAFKQIERLNGPGGMPVKYLFLIENFHLGTCGLSQKCNWSS